MNDIIRQISSARRVAIFSHVRPDGDTIGSVLALRLVLLNEGKEVGVFCEDTPPDKFSFLTGYECYNAEKYADFDLSIAVDCSDELRLGCYKDAFLRSKNTANIDHHRSNTKFAKTNLVDENAAATALLVLKVIKTMKVRFGREIAECLYTGISTDTGNFSHSNTDRACFYAACELIEQGVDVSAITTCVYKSSPKSRTLLLGHVISRMRFYQEDKIAVMTVMQQDFDRFGAEKADTEGFIDMAIGIKGVEVAACIMQSDANNYKVSLRSKSADVCRVATGFGGGGHKLASGCAVSGFLEDAVDKIVRAIGIELSCAGE